jgi:phosphoribosyl 1,2-cyclic phosphodiesterase
MEITFWGCRGSIPTPGSRTNKYGGNTTCVEVRLSDGSLIVLDAGTGIRNLGKSMMRNPNGSEIYLILTHPHWDHLMGFPFFAPAYSNRYRIHIRGGPIAKETVRRYLDHQMQPPYFPARFFSLKAQFDFTHGIPMVKHIGSAEVIPIALSHPNGGYGYKIVEGSTSFVFLTDNEVDYGHEGSLNRYEYTNICRDADLLVHDAQYTDKEYERTEGWGHSTYSSAIRLAVQANVKRLGLFHHDPDRDDQSLDRILTVCQEEIARRKKSMYCFAAMEGTKIRI